MSVHVLGARRACLGAGLVSVLSACGVPRARVEQTEASRPIEPRVTPFSSGHMSPPGQEGWARASFHPSKPPTRYELIEVSGERVLEARSEQSVSGLMHPVQADPRMVQWVEWRWWIENALRDTDIGDRHSDDSPARLMLTFDGDSARLPVKEQMLGERFKLFTGRDMPFATLMYTWDASRPVESITPSPHTAQVRKIVVQSGASQVRTWMRFRRNFREDFLRAFGEEPGRLSGLIVMTDSDNTKQHARSLYGDIRLHAHVS